MVYAISFLIGSMLLGVFVMSIMVSRAMDYDPAWDEEKEKLDIGYREE